MPLLYTATAIRTYSGLLVDVLNPETDNFQIEDIAHALSQLCRYGGHSPRFYSVAQHSYLCARMAPVKLQMQALMHDASEAYLCDVPSPIKPALKNYQVIEEHLMVVIAKRFGFQYPLDEQIHEIDKIILHQEWDELIMGKGTTRFNTWSPEFAKHMFLDMFYEIRINT